MVIKKRELPVCNSNFIFKVSVINNIVNIIKIIS